MRSPTSALPLTARTPLRCAAAAAAAALLLAGCSGGGSGREGKAGEDEKSPSSPTDEVVAKAALPYREFDGEAEFEVNSLAVRGDLMQLDYTITLGDTEEGPNVPSLSRMFDFSLTASQITLVDMENLERYFVVTDDNDNLLQPRPGTELAYGEPTPFTAYYAAPRAGVTELDLHPFGQQPLMDVPVTGAAESDSEDES